MTKLYEANNHILIDTDMLKPIGHSHMAAHIIVSVNGKIHVTSENAEYELIGFASGIDFGKFYASIENFAKDNLPIHKNVFFLYTCAMNRSGFTDRIREIAASKDAVILGEYGCRGWNTYGPWKAIGGMNKKHPTEREIAEAVRFFESLLA